MDPALWEVMDGDPSGQVSVLIRVRPRAELPAGVRVVARFGSVVTARVRRSDVGAVRAHPSVASLKAARAVRPDPDLAVTAARAGAARRAARAPRHEATGRGVVIGVVDWGLDVTHPNLRRRDGGTRLLALWDQRPRTRGGGPEPYGYGRVLTRTMIDRALGSPDPFEALAYDPADADLDGTGSHGTHVLDIAAGAPRVGPGGVAPQATLVFVHLASERSGPKGIGNSVSLLEAVDFISGVAGNRPCVINLSLGSHAGPHDGSTLVEQALDAFVTRRDGRAIVQSAGNYHARPVHATGRLRGGARDVVEWLVSAEDDTTNELDLWYPGRDRIVARLVDRAGRTVARATPASHGRIVIDGAIAGRFGHRLHDPNNGDNQVTFVLDPRGAAERWRVAIEPLHVESRDGHWHAWIERDEGAPGSQSRLRTRDRSPRPTTGTIANGHHTIVVGAYDSRTGAVAPFSSEGPTRDGRPKPDLLAPGVGIVAARSMPIDDDRDGGGHRDLTRKSGTSMAAPHVTGTVALLYEAAGRPLSIGEVREALGVTSPPTRLNVVAAVARVRAAGPETQPRPPWALFDSVLRDRGAPASELGEHHLVAAPGHLPLRPITRGDLVIQRALGEGELARAGRVTAVDASGLAEVEGVDDAAGNWALRVDDRIAWDTAIVILREPGTTVPVGASPCDGPVEAPCADVAVTQIVTPLDLSVDLDVAPVADDPIVATGVDLAGAQPQNLHWWTALGLADVIPVRGARPDSHPVAYANRTIAAQRFLVAQHLDRRVLDRRITPDGVLGPDTLTVLRAIATDPDLAGFRTDVSALGFSVTRVEQRGAAAGAVAAITALPATALASWRVTASSNSVLDFFEQYHQDSPTIRARWMEDLFGNLPEASRPRFSWEAVLEILRRLYGGRQLTGRAAFLDLRRDGPIETDVEAMRRRAGRTGGMYLWWSLGERGFERAANAVGLRLPTTSDAEAAERTWREGTDGRSTVHLVVEYDLPDVSPEQRRAQVAAWLDEEFLLDHIRAAGNREAVKPFVDDVIAHLGERHTYRWELAFAERLAEMSAYPADVRAMLLDEVASPQRAADPDTNPRGRLDELFDAFGRMHSPRARAVLAAIVVGTPYEVDAGYRRFLDEHERKTNRMRRHAYDPVLKEIYLDQDRGAVVRPGQIVGQIKASYYRDDTIEVMKSARRKEPCRLTMLELAQVIAEHNAKADQTDGSEWEYVGDNELAARALDRAEKRLQPPFSLDDLERIDVDTSVRVLDLRPVTRDGLTRAEIKFELVQRVDGGDWQSVPCSARWGDETDFGTVLFTLWIDDISDFLTWTLIIGAAVGTIMLMWATGLGLALIRALLLRGVSAWVLGANVLVSELIELISNGGLTWESAMWAAVRGYFATVGLRLFAPVGQAVQRGVLGAGSAASFRRALAASLLGQGARGAGTGAFEQVATQLAQDIVRFARSGAFSSLKSYLQTAAVGASFGAVGEIALGNGLSYVFGGLRGSAAEKLAGVLSKHVSAKEVAETLLRARVKFDLFVPRLAHTLSRFKQWAREVIEQPALLQPVVDEVPARLREIVAAFADAAKRAHARGSRNVALSFYHDILALSNGTITQGSARGIERLLDESAHRLGRDGMVEVLQALARRPDRSGALLELLGVLDKEVLEALSRRDVLRGLVEREGLAALLVSADAGQARNVLQIGFGGSLDALDDWALRWSALDGSARDRVLGVLARHGDVVSPELALRFGAANRLDRRTLAGLDRLGRAGSRDALDAVTAEGALEPPRLDALIAMAASDPHANGALVALMRDPDRGLRLLGGAPDVATARDWLDAAAHDAARVDDIVRAMGPGGASALDALERAGLLRLLRVGRTLDDVAQRRALDALGDETTRRALLHDLANLDDPGVTRRLARPPATRPAATYPARIELLIRSRGAVESHVALTSGPVPPGNKLNRYLDRPANWLGERRALHDAWIAEATDQLRQFADQLPGPPTLYASRGATAVGKSRALKLVPELESAMTQTEGLLFRTLNPDPFKAAARRDFPPGTVNSQQVHTESATLHRRLERDVRGLRRSDGELASLVLDGRLLTPQAVSDAAVRAQQQGRAFVLYDIDAPFELTLLGVMMRDPFAGADPVPPFGELARGFREARNNRQEVIDWVSSSSDSVGRYELYVTGPGGQHVKAMETRAAQRDPTVLDVNAHDAATEKVMDADLARIQRQVLEPAYIDELLRGLPPRVEADARRTLRDHVAHGRTWEEAVTAHGRLPPENEP